jgi:hypothetical protein
MRKTRHTCGAAQQHRRHRQSRVIQARKSSHASPPVFDMRGRVTSTHRLVLYSRGPSTSILRVSIRSFPLAFSALYTHANCWHSATVSLKNGPLRSFCKISELLPLLCKLSPRAQFPLIPRPALTVTPQHVHQVHSTTHSKAERNAQEAAKRTL